MPRKVTSKPKDGYSPAFGGKRSAAADRKKLKGIKSPDPNAKKYSYYVGSMRMWIYADNKRTLEQMKAALIK